MPGAKSVYLHFPFCETKCHYCDFYSLGREKTRETDAKLFEDALSTEIMLRAPELLSATLDTVFLGGGTPSMTEPESMARVLEHLFRHSKLAADYEWTLEGNPSSLSTDRLQSYQALGVNRISMGVQALDDTLLKKLGRVHSSADALRALNAVFESGIKNASVDLLCGVPGQSLEHLETALKDLTAFPITHLSCYLLTLPPHHPMHRELPSEDTQLEHLLCIHRWMSSRGFEHYEISNYAKPGFRARHNLAYWLGHPYAGFGPSAHSFDSRLKIRSKNVSSLRKYASLVSEGMPPVDFQESLTPEQLNLERWLLGSRLSEGFPTTWLETSGQKIRATRLIEHGFLEPHPETSGNLRLTPKGFAVSDSIIQELAS